MSNSANIKTIKLEENLGLSALASLQTLLSENRGVSICVDTSDVQTISGLCLQLLLSAEKTWAAEDLAFEVSAQSEAFKDALSHTGIATFANEAQGAA